MPRRNIKVTATTATRDAERNRKRARLAARKAHVRHADLPTLKTVGLAR